MLSTTKSSKALRRAGATLALAAAAYAAPALAVVSGPPAVRCDFSGTTLDAGYVACAGPLPGSFGAGQVDTVSFAGQGSFTLAGLAGDLSGAFATDPGTAAWGTLSLGQLPRGPYVIGLQGDGSYSLYLFSGGGSSLGFDTYGVADALGWPGPALAQAALFTAAVPEPASSALLLAGLATVGSLARWRRRRCAV